MDELGRRAVFFSTLDSLRKAIGAEPDEFANLLMETAMLLAPQLFICEGDEDDDEVDGAELMQ